MKRELYRTYNVPARVYITLTSGFASVKMDVVQAEARSEGMNVAGREAWTFTTRSLRVSMLTGLNLGLASDRSSMRI